ncbi:MAG TPA: hypothetical protein VGC04_00335 [Cellulomonas sp.]
MAESAAGPLIGSAPEAGVLHLVSIVVSGLPPELGTADEPARYTVPAAFSRPVTPEERARIEDPATARRLGRRLERRLGRSGRGLALVVTDGQLLIKNTTLAELRGGLAAALAGLLRQIDQDLEAERAQRSAEPDALGVEAHARAAAVTTAAAVNAAAAAVRFE